LTLRYSSSECMLISLPLQLIFEPLNGMAGSSYRTCSPPTNGC
jgi:hypothetical protein